MDIGVLEKNASLGSLNQGAGSTSWQNLLRGATGFFWCLKVCLKKSQALITLSVVLSWLFVASQKTLLSVIQWTQVSLANNRLSLQSLCAR